MHERTAGDRVTTVSNDSVSNARLITGAKLYVVEFIRRVARPDDDRATRKIFCVGYDFLKHLRKQGKEALVHKSGFQLERPLWVASRHWPVARFGCGFNESMQHSDDTARLEFRRLESFSDVG